MDYLTTNLRRNCVNDVGDDEVDLLGHGAAGAMDTRAQGLRGGAVLTDWLRRRRRRRRRTPQRQLELGRVDVLDVLVRQRQDDRGDVLLEHGV